jgi:hypothetical protein
MNGTHTSMRCANQVNVANHRQRRRYGALSPAG